MTAKTRPTVHLRFVKRRVGRNVVRILQQQWENDVGFADTSTTWRDVELMEDGEPTTRDFLLEGR